MLEYARELLQIPFKDGGGLQCVSYDTQFNIGDFYVSTLTIRDVRFRHNSKGKALPILPVFMFLHEKKSQSFHNWAFEVMVNLLPELKRNLFVAISDKEFPNLLKRHFKKAFVALDEIHMTKDIQK